MRMEVLSIYFDMEQGNGSTSLQTILLQHTRQSVEAKITELFVRREYPSFELGQFYAHPLFSSHEKFHFFIDILEQWNRKIHKGEIPAFSEALFKKNTFIYDSLKNATLHAPHLADHQLRNLFLWFNGTRNTTLKMAHMRKPETRPTDEEWEIRNTFKSNLPAEIGMYRRRVFWDYGKDKCMSAKMLESCGRKVRTEAEEVEGRNEVEDKRIAKIEHALVREEVERKEFLSIQNKWKIKKYRESEAGVKNYYNGAFNNSKTYFSRKQQAPHDKETDVVTLKRVHTSLGYRSTTKKTPETAYNRFSQNDAILTGFRTAPQREPSFEEFEGNKENEILHRVGTVDGLRLLSNPFEKKLKKKKRRS